MLIYLQSIETEAGETKFERLYHQYRGLMFHVAMMLLADPRDAEDAVHQAFLGIAANITRVDDSVPARVKSYAVTAAERAALDILRERGPAKLPLEEETGGLMPEPGEAHGLADCILRLPPRQRQVILLRYHHGYTQRETAKILGMGLPALKQTDRRARERLRQMLKEQEVDV